MLKTRIITALVLLAVFIPALYLMPSMLWASLTFLFTLLGLNEWAGMLSLSDRNKKLYLLLATVLGLLALYGLWVNGIHPFFYLAMPVFVVVSLFWVLLVPVWLLFTTKTPPQAISIILGVLLLGAFWLALVCAKEANPSLMLVIISTAWLSDSAAYFTGKKFGRHKLAPAISPNKTWEGVAGAFLVITLYGILLKLLGTVATWWLLPCLWLITMVGVYGDLLESLYKRHANLKDSGQLLPGHGGLLDRVDSMVAVLPLGLILVYSFRYLNTMYSF